MPDDASPQPRVPSPKEEVYDTLCAVLFWHRLELRKGRPGLPEDLVVAVQEASDLITRLELG